MENNKELELREIFGKRLKLLRKGKLIALKEMSIDLLEKVGIEVNYATLANYERGHRVPTLYVLTKLAEYFDVSTDYLMGITDIENANILQGSIFDENNKEHTLKIGIDKNSDLSKMTIEEIENIREVVEKLKERGFNMDKNK